LTQTEHVAVGLVVVGANAGAQEIRRDVAGELDGGQPPLGEQAESRLTCGGVEFGGLTARVSWKRNLLEARIGIGVVGFVPENRFSR
jgi:hypothetical protein